jgi:uncharacterized protein (TIGR02453 family)
MPFDGFSERTVRFLAELARNNEHAWFEAHREECASAVIEPAQAFVEVLGQRLRELDPKLQAIPRVRGSIKAFERRRRFPKSPQPPYRESLDLWFWSGRRRAWDNSGFFMRLTPERLVLAGGMIEFQEATRVRYRADVLDDARGGELEAIVAELRASGYVVAGESFKRTPRGVPAEHPRAALLKHGGLFTTRDGEHPAELGAAAFVDYSFAHFAGMARLHAWLVALQR